MGSGPLPSARPRGPARAHGRPIPADVRVVRRAPAPAARRLPAPGPHEVCALRRLAPVLVARQAPHGPRGRAAARRRLPAACARRRREPGLLRAAPPGCRGPGAGGPAAGGRHLHGGSRRSEPGRHHAALPRAGATRAQRRSRPLAGGSPRAAGGHERRALEPLRDPPRRDGGAGGRARRATAGGRRAPQAAGDGHRARGRGLAAGPRIGRQR